MIVMDSSGWLEIVGDGPRADAFSEALQRSERVVVPTIVVREVYRAVEIAGGRRRADQTAHYLARFDVLPLDFDTAVAAARLGKELKLALADSIIYATAQRVGARVVTGDNDFAALPDVHFIPVEQ